MKRQHVRQVAPLFHQLPLVSLCSVSTSFASPHPRHRRLCDGSHRSVTERGLPWQLQHSVSVSSARRRQRWVCTPLPQTLLHSVYFSLSLSSHRTIPLLGIKQAKWGHAFIRRELWLYPSLSLHRRRKTTLFRRFLLLWQSLSHSVIEFRCFLPLARSQIFLF